MVTEAGSTRQIATLLPRTFSRRELGIGARDLVLRCYAWMAAFEYALRHGKSLAPIIDELNNPAYRNEQTDPALDYLRQVGIIGSPLKERVIFGY